MSAGPERTLPADAGAPVPRDERVPVLDVLRGFALLGIVVVNLAAFKAPLAYRSPDPGALDEAARWLVSTLAAGKFYLLFSFLFGYGLSVQTRRWAGSAGTALRPRFLRRLLGLFLLGLAHALLLFVGDILMIYAVLGLVLLALRAAAPRALLGTAAALVGAHASLFLLAGAATGALAGDAGDAGDTDLYALSEPERRQAEAVMRAYRGSVTDVVGQRVADLPEALATGLLVQVPSVLAMFLVGLAAGRLRLLERLGEPASAPLLRRVQLLGLLVGLPGSVVFAALDASGTAWAVLGLGVLLLTAPLLTGLYVATIVRVWTSPAGARLLAPLAPVGRMALTNYLLESLLAALVFTGYGLGWFGRVGPATGLLVAAAIWLVLLPWSRWWLARFDLGPAEWLLRSFTYRRRLPLRRQGPLPAGRG